jgi:hypothetical protein
MRASPLLAAALGAALLGRGSAVADDCVDPEDAPLAAVSDGAGDADGVEDAAPMAPGGVIEPRASTRRPWYLPDQAKLQFAGDIGFLSPGLGYSLARGRLEADLFFGWVPRAIGAEDIVSFTGKLTWVPWRIPVERRWYVRPLTLGLQVTYTLGDEYFVTVPSRYGPGYYDFPTALRAGIALGGGVGRRLGGAIREVGLYYELVALDAMLFLWARNTRALGPEDVFTLALGVRVGL